MCSQLVRSWELRGMCECVSEKPFFLKDFFCIIVVINVQLFIISSMLHLAEDSISSIQ